ncbi:phosphopantetheine-binding protein [Desulfobacter vibrioformis]|uniref:phosphopantetheine-binding protein n=1 Tax=Desulfobacter vibrioformis TaxID=34031 RepID=UPI000553C3CE|nr:phosphopantetheine-binding protein [Desulfobacter vibrioformis]
MKKEEVVQLLMKNLKLVIPEFEDETVDTSLSYKDLGVSSLELVEIVAVTSKEMGVKLSPTALASVKTTEDLTQVLMAAKAK